jgi:ABC-type transporter Mla subunit MlaD
VLEFQAGTAELYRAVNGADRAATEIEQRIEHLLRAAQDTPAASEQQATELRALRARMQDLRVTLNGDATLASRYEPVPLDLLTRVATIAGGTWGSQSAVTGNHRASLEVASAQLPKVLEELRSIEAGLTGLEQVLEGVGAPWTPSRIPDWPAAAD